jgi:chaperonin GroES
MENNSEKIINYVKTWQPISDRVVVLPDKKEEGEIIQSDTKQGEDKRVSGVVLAVGKGRYSEQGSLIPMESNIGDVVLFGKYSGDDVLVDEDLKIDKYNGIVRDNQILVTIVRQDSLLTNIPL